MCKSLTVTCQRRVAGIPISDHYLTLTNLKIPCKERGTAACKAGEEAILKDFQNPPTMCAGLAAGFKPGTEACEAACMEALEKYGRSLYQMNTRGPQKKAGWFNWLTGASKAEEEPEDHDKGIVVVPKKADTA